MNSAPSAIGSPVLLGDLGEKARRPMTLPQKKKIQVPSRHNASPHWNFVSADGPAQRKKKMTRRGKGGTKKIASTILNILLAIFPSSDTAAWENLVHLLQKPTLEGETCL